MLDFSECRLPPFKHQLEDTEIHVNQPFLANFSEMRTGKTKVVIDAAQFLFRMGLINRVIVVAPGNVRSVWFDPEFGELKTHLWFSVAALITEFHTDVRQWKFGEHAPDKPILRWIITNFEFLRPRESKKTLLKDWRHTEKLLEYCNKKTLLVIDESGEITNHKSGQFKSCYELRQRCGRVVILNGTPADTQIHYFAQGNFLHKKILECPTKKHFLSRYAVMGGYEAKVEIKNKRGEVIKTYTKPTQVLEWINIDDLQRRFAPYVIRRLQKDLPDMPAKLPPQVLTANLTESTWNTYRKMRDELLVELRSGSTSVARVTVTKILRLSQIVNGYLGGFDLDDEDDSVISGVKELSHEKHDLAMWLIEQQFIKDSMLKIIAWVRFKLELDRLIKACQDKFPNVKVVSLHGGQKADERLETKRLLHPTTAPNGPVICVGTFGTGSYGLDFTAASVNINVGSSFSYRKAAQSADRVYGPRQKRPISYFDLVAIGPKGQKTIDHTIIAARMKKQSLSEFTTSAWEKALTDE